MKEKTTPSARPTIAKYALGKPELLETFSFLHPENRNN
jgi:hypothetical protein